MFNVVSMQIKRQLVSKALRLGDLFALLLVFALVTWVPYSREDAAAVSWSEFLAWRISVKNAVIMAGFLLLWTQVFRLCGLYDVGRFSRIGHEALGIAKATTLATVGMAAAGTVLQLELVTPRFVLAFWLGATLAVIAVRLAVRWGLAQRGLREPHLRRVLIVGTNSRARRLAEDLAQRPELGYRLIGFLDTHREGVGPAPLPQPVVADCANFPAFLREHVVDEVLLCLPLASCYHEAARIMQLCEEQGILVRVLGTIFDAKLASMAAEEFCAQSVLTFQVGRMRGGTVLLKRLVDVTMAATAAVGLLPVLLVTALAVKLDSRGPALFVQERVGLNKRRFRLYKFRTMVTDAEQRQAELEHLNEVAGAAFKITNDPRITRLGRFLRKTSLDELPQLFNVIKGDMSLVGPRPLPPRDYKGFSEDWHRRRFSVPPGITCLWQVSGRSRLSFERWMELDMEYIDRWSLSLDMHILLRTIPVVLRRDGAV
jgi:exopolysaccharide biosynthesis polyprenyl glycosylphosphotransferase